MTDLPLVSVLIPCYNGEQYLREAIDSCLAQTYARVEIVVVNDGSKDSSADVAKSYGDRIVYVEQKNRGLSGARNTAIAVSSGDFVILCDSDDILLPDCIEKRMQPLLADPDVAIVAGYFREIDADGALSPRIPELRSLSDGEHYWQELKRNFGPPVGWTIRKSAFIKAGVFDPMLPHCEDYDLCLRILTHYKMAYIPDVTVHYRQHAGGQSKRFIEYYDGVRQILRKNSCYTRKPLLYWWMCQYAKFEAGRRILYSVLRQTPRGDALRSLVTYCARRPEFLWIGLFSALSFLRGKRASANR